MGSTLMYRVLIGEPIQNLLSAGFLALWFLATILGATPIGRLWLRSDLISRFVPRWNFFAPRPGTQDFRLVHREVVTNNCTGPWHELPLPPRGPWEWIWNPNKRLRKCIIDITISLVGEMIHYITRKESHLIKISIPYLLVLRYVVSLPRSPFADGIQFAIIRNSRSDETPVLVFLSGVHSLP